MMGAAIFAVISLKVGSVTVSILPVALATLLGFTVREPVIGK